MTRTRIILALLILLPASQAFACPACTYQRMLQENWHIKWAAINLIVPLLLVGNRLDPVRVLYVLIPYVALAFKIHWFLLRHTFSVHGLMAIIAAIGWWVWALNLLGVALLLGVSRIPFFRWNKDRGLAIWQPIAYSLIVLVLGMIIR